jgi:sugar/nucleoside kinase (ribokinase family)
MNDQTITIIGDVMVEFYSEISNVEFINIDKDILLYKDITCRACGTGLSLAKKSIKYFSKVNIISKVGNDNLGSIILSDIRENKITPFIFTSHVYPTSMSIYIRDGNRNFHKGSRIIIIQEESANLYLNKEDIEKISSDIIKSSLLFIDGYCINSKDRAVAVEYALRLAKDNNIVTAFDIVPHDIYKMKSLDDIHAFLNLSDVIIAEINTLSQLIGIEVTENKQSIDNLVTVCQQHLGAKVFLLRYGIGNIDKSAIYLPGQDAHYYDTGYSTAQNVSGFGDELSAKELAQILPLISSRRIS